MTASTSGFLGSPEFERIQYAAHDFLIDRITELGSSFADWPRDRLIRVVRQEVSLFVASRQVAINEREVTAIADALIKELIGYGPIEDLLNDDSVEDILINGPHSVVVSRRGVLTKEAVRFRDNEHLVGFLRRLLAPLGRRLDESSPMVDARLPSGGRLNAIIPPLAVDGAAVSIRKFHSGFYTGERMVEAGALSPELLDFLAYAVRQRCNLLVIGGTSSGKTSMLNVLSNYIPAGERVITIEDTAELDLQHPHVVKLESRPGGYEGAGQVTIRDLVRNSLRMRPDRIVVGEVRGAEVLEMLQAMSTGHDGSMGTLHASSALDALYRLEMLAGFAGFTGSDLSLRRQVASAVDLIVQVGRLADGRRRMLAVTEVTGMNQDMVAMQELFRYSASPAPHWERTDARIHNGKLLAWERIHA
ncbi:CpaF family protein [Jeongeupia chitinilytica]|uniref:Pilus assembly protein CpaF n=1 Tax=Jeongeupia chitinilytica TaxID=1041641 RepID=A0ABQ3H276_9NEIS|nr:CpaF family protein [Jeongeupia chitinilytica]GHD62055.1 pilus assembly protein CpaF [Jeongeupia chitinilytica]